MRTAREYRTYYWLITVSPTSAKPLLLGPYGSEQEAQQIGFDKVGGAFDIAALKTRDVGRASQILRAQRASTSRRLGDIIRERQK